MPLLTLAVLRMQREGKPLPYVYGVVLSKFGLPMVNARVTLHSQTKRHSAKLETHTREDGHFEFTTIPPDGYIVVVKPSHGGSPMKDSFGSVDPGVRLILHE